MNAIFFSSYVVLWILVVLVTIVVIIAVRQLGLLNLRVGGRMAMTLPAGPSIGERAPEFASSDLEGETVASPWLQDRASLLVFVSPGCAACPQIMPSVRAIRRSDRRHLSILLVSTSVGDGNAEYARKSLCQVLVDPDVATAYHIDTTPYAIVIDSNGIVRAKGVVNQIEHIESLLDHLSHPIHAEDVNSSQDGDEAETGADHSEQLLRIRRG